MPWPLWPRWSLPAWSASLSTASPMAPRVHTSTGLLHEHRRTMTTVIGLHALAALASLVAPRLVGELVDGVTHGTTRAHIDTAVARAPADDDHGDRAPCPGRSGLAGRSPLGRRACRRRHPWHHACTHRHGCCTSTGGR